MEMRRMGSYSCIMYLVHDDAAAVTLHRSAGSQSRYYIAPVCTFKSDLLAVIGDLVIGRDVHQLSPISIQWRRHWSAWDSAIMSE